MEEESAPSDTLRRWYNHDPDKWAECQSRYERELASPAAQLLLEQLAERAKHGHVTLIYAAHAGEISNTAALLRLIQERIAHTHDKQVSA